MTRNQRASILGLALASFVVLPAPDVLIDQADRQQVAFSYAGISANVPVIPPEFTRVRGLKVSVSSAIGAEVAVSSALRVQVRP